MLIRLKSSSTVLVMIGSMPMPTCSRFHERLANNGKITTFKGIPLFDAFVRRFSWTQKNRDLDRRNLCSMLKISYAASPCPSQLISVQFALEMCLAARNRQKIYKTYFSVQDHPMSLNSVTIESQLVYDLILLVINSNLSLISHCYWDTATYWLKVTKFSYLSLI